MKENVTLIQEINDLRKEVRTLEMKLRQIGSSDMVLGSTARSKLETSIRSKGDQPVNEVQKELKLQGIQIDDLEKQIQEFEEQNELLRMQRPRVGGKLPPLEGT
jgi:predicted RNase H-like nuclease (RuvC/YqgF family)